MALLGLTIVVAETQGPAWAQARRPSARAPRPDLAPDPNLPDDTKLWAVLQNASGGVWGGCVYDAEAIALKLRPLLDHRSGECW